MVNTLVNVHASNVVAQYLKAEGNRELTKLSTFQQLLAASNQLLMFTVSSNDQKVLNVLSPQFPRLDELTIRRSK